MPSCRSRKTGNCSDWFKNKRLPQKVSETGPDLFLFPDRLPYALANGAAKFDSSGEVPAWHWSGKPFFWTINAVSGPGWYREGQGTEWHRVPLGYPAKAGVPSQSVPGDELRSVSLIGDLDFDCVSTAVWHDSCRRNRLEPSGSQR